MLREAILKAKGFFKSFLRYFNLDEHFTLDLYFAKSLKLWNNSRHVSTIVLIMSTSISFYMDVLNCLD